MKVFWGISFCSVLFFLLIILAVSVIVLLFCSVVSAETITAMAAILSFGVNIVAVIYAIKQYERHLKDEQIKLLCDYNQRYSSDSKISSVITWMLKIAILDENGNIIGANPYIATYCEPGINEKEMFMRFFEELYLQIESKQIDKTAACRLFAYYAVKFDEYEGFRMDITDYKNDSQLNEMSFDDKKKFSVYWSNYRMFVREMKEEWKTLKSKF